MPAKLFQIYIDISNIYRLFFSLIMISSKNTGSCNMRDLCLTSFYVNKMYFNRRRSL